MPSSQDSKMQRAAFSKAYRGRRLLNAGGYEAAIFACTEAIELDPNNTEPYRIRAEAYKRLGRDNEAEADLKILGDSSPIDDLDISVIDDA